MEDPKQVPAGNGPADTAAGKVAATSAAPAPATPNVGGAAASATPPAALSPEQIAANHAAADSTKQPERVVTTLTPPGQPDVQTKVVSTPGTELPAPGGVNTVATTAIDPMHPAPVIESAKEAAAEAPQTVTMSFPRPVLLTVNHTKQIKFEAGPQEVPADLVDHPYLIAHGVTRYHASAPGSAYPAPFKVAGPPTPLSDEELLLELKRRSEAGGKAFEDKAKALFGED